MGGMPAVSNIAMGSVYASNQAQAAANAQWLSNAQMNAAINTIGNQLQNQLQGNSAFNSGNPTPASNVARTAASRVLKPDWEIEEDRKDRELDEMIARQRDELASVVASEQASD